MKPLGARGPAIEIAKLIEREQLVDHAGGIRKQRRALGHSSFLRGVSYEAMNMG